jgi:fumarylpyruvate hydrolase
MTTYLWNPPATPSLPVRGKIERLPVHRLFFIGRNYHAHAIEMGSPVDKAAARAFYFTKSCHALVESGATVPYPPETQNYHFEMELVIVIGKAGFRITQELAHEHIYGYASGLDMTRRDLQAVARKQGHPWDMAKDVENGAVCSEVVPMPGVVLEQGEISLSVNGVSKQHADINQMVWSIREIIADLSLYYHLQPGDLIYTGTPEGVGAVLPGDKIVGQVQGVGTVTLHIGAAE